MRAMATPLPRLARTRQRAWFKRRANNTERSAQIVKALGRTGHPFGTTFGTAVGSYRSYRLPGRPPYHWSQRPPWLAPVRARACACALHAGLLPASLFGFSLANLSGSTLDAAQAGAQPSSPSSPLQPWDLTFLSYHINPSAEVQFI